MNMVQNKISANKDLIKVTTEKLRNINDSYFEAEILDHELIEEVIKPYKKINPNENLDLCAMINDLLKVHVEVDMEEIINIEQFNVLRDEEFHMLEKMDGSALNGT